MTPTSTISQKLSAVKAIPLRDALPRLGISVSPQGFFKVRDERTASTHILPSGKMWFDHGSQQSGDLVSLFQSLTNQSFAEAVSTLFSQFYGTFDGILPTYRPTAQSPSERTKTPIFQATELGIPTSTTLLHYACNVRRIPLPIVEDLTSAVAVRYATPKPGTANKPTLALGWKGADGQTWHTRCGMDGARAKCVCGHQSISVLPFGSQYITIFEGYFSMMSAMALKPLITLQGDILVLNSCANIDKAVNHISGRYNTVYLCLDRDTAGMQATAKLTQMLSKIGIRAVDINQRIPLLQTADLMQDLNDILVARPDLICCRSCRICQWYQRCNIARGKWTHTARKCRSFSPVNKYSTFQNNLL